MRHFITILAFVFLTSCLAPSYPVIQNNEIGDKYIVIGDLYLAGEILKFDSWFAEMEEVSEGKSSFYKFKKGTVFQITELKKVTHSSWNTGTYSFPVLELKALTGDKKGEVFKGYHIINDNEIGVDGNIHVLQKVIK